MLVVFCFINVFSCTFAFIALNLALFISAQWPNFLFMTSCEYLVNILYSWISYLTENGRCSMRVCIPSHYGSAYRVDK